MIIHAALGESVMQIGLIIGMLVNRLQVIVLGRYVFWLISRHCGYCIGREAGGQSLLVIIVIKLLMSPFISFFGTLNYLQQSRFSRIRSFLERVL